MPVIVFLAIALRLAGAIQWSLLLYWARKRQIKNDTRSFLFQAFAFAVTGYLMNAVAFVFPSLYYLGYAFLIPAFACAPFIWLCTKAFFEDDFRFSKVHALIAAGAILLPFAIHPNLPCSRLFYSWFGDMQTLKGVIGFLVPQAITLCFVTLSLYVAHKGRASDLVESRLRYRRILIWTVCLAAIIVDTAEYVTKLKPEIWAHLDILTALLIFTIGYVLTQNLQHPESSILARIPRSGVEVPDLSVRNSSPFSERAEKDFQRLIAEDKVFLQPNLNLETLARLLKMPEYRLRRHINGVLGHQNFNQFLNHYRIIEAKRILADPQTARIPIYNLSVDLGYGSAVSFNRAFRESTGMTPTLFRDRFCENVDFSAENRLSISKIPSDFKN